MSTPKQLAEKIGIEYHGIHYHTDQWKKKYGHFYLSWEAFLVCTHEICEDSRTLIGHLEYQARLLKDCELFLGPKGWTEISGKQEVSA